jgi:hypothetical protein
LKQNAATSATGQGLPLWLRWQHGLYTLDC